MMKPSWPWRDATWVTIHESHFTRPTGKYDHLDDALCLVKPGGLYIIDDLLPQPSWPDGHAAKVTALLSDLTQRADLLLTKLSWASGLIVATKRA
jgi:hypothetical protein